MSAEWVAAWAAVVAVIVSIVYSHLTNRTAKRLAKVEMTLQIDDRLSSMEKVHLAIRHGLLLDVNGVIQNSGITWADVDSYMGVFERIQSFIEEDVMDVGTAWDFYGYRYVNLLKSGPIIQHKLQAEPKSWHRFLKLGGQLQSHVETLKSDQRDPENEPGRYLKVI